MLRDEILGMFPKEYRSMFAAVAKEGEQVQEIRLRAGGPVIIHKNMQECFLMESGAYTIDIRIARIMNEQEIEDIISHICSYSIYAYENEMKQGFVTMPGGHRIGMAGQTVVEDNHIRMMKNIRYLNIRISHEVKGAAKELYPLLYEEKELCNTLILSPPGCGKTTILRDLIRQISQGSENYQGMTVGVVDERCELSGSYLGVAQNDLGPRTDVLLNCPKDLGMMMLIRSMSPKVLAVDEIGSTEDARAILYAIRCGCRLIATIHAENFEELKEKKSVDNLLQEKIFKRFVVMKRKEGKCVVDKIYGDRSSTIWGNGYR